MAARYGPTDSAGSKATGSEKNRLREAASSAACEAGRCWATRSSSERSLSASASGTCACISPARYRALSRDTCSRDSATRETAVSIVAMCRFAIPSYSERIRPDLAQVEREPWQDRVTQEPDRLGDAFGALARAVDECLAIEGIDQP